jgi:hypothetical protein
LMASRHQSRLHRKVRRCHEKSPILSERPRSNWTRRAILAFRSRPRETAHIRGLVITIRHRQKDDVVPGLTTDPRKCGPARLADGSMQAN